MCCPSPTRHTPAPAAQQRARGQRGARTRSARLLPSPIVATAGPNMHGCGRGRWEGKGGHDSGILLRAWPPGRGGRLAVGIGALPAAPSGPQVSQPPRRAASIARYSRATPFGIYWSLTRSAAARSRRPPRVAASPRIARRSVVGLRPVDIHRALSMTRSSRYDRLVAAAPPRHKWYAAKRSRPVVGGQQSVASSRRQGAGGQQ